MRCCKWSSCVSPRTRSTSNQSPTNLFTTPSSPASCPPHKRRIEQRSLRSPGAENHHATSVNHVTPPWWNNVTVCYMPWIVFLSRSRSARQCLIRSDATLDQDWGTESVEEFLLAREPTSYAEVCGLFIHCIKEAEGVRQQEEQEDKRDEVNGEVEEVTHRCACDMTMTMGVNEDSNLSRLEPDSVRVSRKTVKGQRHLLTTQRETTKTKDLQCMKTHALASIMVTCSPSVSGHFTHHLPIFGLTRTKTGLLRCCLYTPRRLQQTAVSYNDPSATKWRTKKIVKVVRLRFYPKTEHNGFLPFYHVALHASSFIDFLWIIVNSTRNRSIATNWRKNSMIGAVAGTSRMA